MPESIAMYRSRLYYHLSVAMIGKPPGRVGFIGLGIMGRPMARNLLKAGYPLTVWNRSRPGIDALVQAGAQEADSPRAVAAQSDAVITILGDSTDTEQVALGERGIIEGAHQGLVHIDMSTISPAVTRAIAERYAETGVEMLDAPVSGGEQGAVDGTLAIMIGGRPETFERCRPLFEALGGTIVHCGPSGAGQVVKLCNQVVVALNNLAMGEALVLAAKAGVDPATMVEVVRSGAGSSWALHNLAPRVLARDFRPGFKIAHQQKDLRLALDLARDGPTPLPGTALVHQLFAALEAEGLGEEGTQALVKALEKLANVTLSP
ncbi:MAG: 2-hydroxy-3-oxopropionate reductase [Dehalococcoidia bacterium]|nr:2-hydroxy-3-oxopropionate reductase [Dehalococcoidia bacterium]